MPAPTATRPAATSLLLFAGRLGGAMLAAGPNPPILVNLKAPPNAAAMVAACELRTHLLGWVVRCWKGTLADSRCFDV